jgi:hypothetical protein
VNQGDVNGIKRDVARIVAINAQVQELKWEAKEIAGAAWNKYGVKAKVVKQLAQESAWDEVQREERRQHEESLDQCRAALGLLADTPLGQAATVVHANGAANGQAAPKKRGRPPGSRNKPKAADEWTRPQLAAAVADAPPVPDVPPDVPDLPPDA